MGVRGKVVTSRHAKIKVGENILREQRSTILRPMMSLEGDFSGSEIHNLG
jgi:hypothetical protein